jgi:DNA-3-methyladenine glycosylase I
MSYCDYCLREDIHSVHKPYHDKYYGFPISSDDELFGRLVLEINQAGLSWETILKKEASFRETYANFKINDVANFSEKDVKRLLNDAGVIRNRLKIAAAIYNANAIIEIKKKNGTFRLWLDEQGNLTINEWVKLFKKHFKFVGGEIVNEFLMSSGYLKGAHKENCPIFAEIRAHKPKWLDYE